MVTTEMARSTPDNLSLGARQSTRVPMHLPVRLGIKEEKGAFQMLVAWTRVLSKYGARIECKRPLDVNQEVTVTVLPSEQRSGMGRVVWCNSKRNENGNFEFGVELREAENLSGITFPRLSTYSEAGERETQTAREAWGEEQ